MLFVYIRFVYHLVRQTEGVHWGLLFGCLSVLSLLLAAYLVGCRVRPSASLSIALHNAVMMVGVLCFMVALFDFTLGRRVGEVISRVPDLTLFDWVLEPGANRFKQALYALFNVALFMPIAGFLSVLWNRDGGFVSAVPIVIALLLGSACIEVAQVALHLGYFQLEDVVCNCVGSFAGIVLARCACRTRAEIEFGI